MSVILPKGKRTSGYTVRYWVDGKQREKSFVTLAEARAFKTDTDHAQRYCVKPIDPRDGRTSFGELAQAYIARLAVSDRSRASYQSVFNSHVNKALGSRALADVARDRGAVTDLLAITMGPLSIDRRRKARQIVTGTLDEAVKAGKLADHKCGDIKLVDSGPAGDRSDFVFPTHDQVDLVAKSVGIAIWLMRGCGLRIGEALGVEKSDFIMGGKVLRISRQATRDGKGSVSLKKRKGGEFRDIPVPGYLRDIVKQYPDGPLCPGKRTRYAAYATVLGQFTTAAKQAGIPAGFHPHSLRHAYASALLGRGVPITDVARWLGHRDVSVTFAVYSHMMPDAPVAAVAALDDEFSAWASKPVAANPREAAA